MYNVLSKLASGPIEKEAFRKAFGNCLYEGVIGRGYAEPYYPASGEEHLHITLAGTRYLIDIEGAVR